MINSQDSLGKTEPQKGLKDASQGRECTVKYLANIKANHKELQEEPRVAKNVLSASKLKKAFNLDKCFKGDKRLHFEWTHKHTKLD